MTDRLRDLGRLVLHVLEEGVLNRHIGESDESTQRDEHDRDDRGEGRAVEHRVDAEDIEKPGEPEVCGQAPDGMAVTWRLQGGYM